MTNQIKSYSELCKLDKFEDRVEYLKLDGVVGKETFGFDRYLNQAFYRSKEWKRIRDSVIIRDMGCDLGVEDRDIHGKLLIHHMNPISVNDIVSRSEFLLNPEYLICVSKRTHDAIHYGDAALVRMDVTERSSNDTTPWKQTTKERD